MTNFSQTLLPLAIILAIVGGCAKPGPVRVHVSGEVTYRGKPLPAGIITLEPNVELGPDGPQGFAQIKDGKFDTRDQGRMACQGPAIVAIQGYDGVSKGRENVLGTALFTNFTQKVELSGNEPVLRIDVKKEK